MSSNFLSIETGGAVQSKQTICHYAMDLSVFMMFTLIVGEDAPE